jgi:hypothetical protein
MGDRLGVGVSATSERQNLRLCAQSKRLLEVWKRRVDLVWAENLRKLPSAQRMGSTGGEDSFAFVLHRGDAIAK